MSTISQQLQSPADATIPTHLVDNIWVGDYNVAKNSDFIKRHNIRRIVNCTATLPFHRADVSNYRIPVADYPSAEENEVFKSHLSEALAFVRYPAPGSYSGVLIHCHVGVSRSCSFAVAYLRAFHFPTLREAVEYLLQRRPVAFFGGRAMNFGKALVEFFGH